MTGYYVLFIFTELSNRQDKYEISVILDMFMLYIIVRSLLMRDVNFRRGRSRIGLKVDSVRCLLHTNSALMFL